MPIHIELWLPFAAGQAIHVLKRAGMMVRSPHNGVQTRRAFVQLYWDALAVRAALCAAVFWMVVDQPELLSSVAGVLGFSGRLELRLNAGTALIFGYFADSILDWAVSRIPIFQKEVPQPQRSEPQQTSNVD